MSGKVNDAPPDFLARMVDKAFGSDAVVAPRMRSVFEPPQEERIAAIPEWTEEAAEVFTKASDGNPREPTKRREPVRAAEPNLALQYEEFLPRSTRDEQAAAVQATPDQPSALPARLQDRGPPALTAPDRPSALHARPQDRGPPAPTAPDRPPASPARPQDREHPAPTARDQPSALPARPQNLGHPALTARHDQSFDQLAQRRDPAPGPMSRLHDAPSASIARQDAERPQLLPLQFLPAGDAISRLHIGLSSSDLGEPVPASASAAPAVRYSETSVVPRPSAHLRTPTAPVWPPESNRRHAAGEEHGLRPLVADQSARSTLVSTPTATSARILVAASSVLRRPQSDQRPSQQLEAPPAPIVNVTIGRVEVRAASAPAAPAPRPVRGPQPLSLDDYLKRRGAR